MHVVATAGHVDHGKSTLVRALTGMEPDRLAEERRRGLTIDLGFVWTELAGQSFAFVDVPGHQRFVPTMLAGVGPVPAVLFVVSADEGWQEQSSEHLAALDAFGVRHGVLAVTKADRADPGPVLAESVERIASSGLGRIPAVAVSGHTGAGLDALRAELGALGARLPNPDRGADVRLWIDRSFSIRGAGTVVTGTLGAGTLSVGDDLVLDRDGRRCVVRALQSLGQAHDTVTAVARVAVNLRGADQHDLGRGDALLTPGAWRFTAEADVRLRGEKAERPRQLVAHIGSVAVPCRVRPLGTGTARLSFARELPLRAGDRGLLRDPGDHRSAGFDVLDPRPPALRRRGAARARAAELACDDPAVAYVRRHGAVAVEELHALGWAVPGRTMGRWAVAEDLPRRLAGRARELVADWHERNPLSAGLPVEALRRSLDVPEDLLGPALDHAGLAVRDGAVTDPARVSCLPEAVERAVRVVERRLAGEPFAAPEAADLAELGLGPKHLAAAERAGRLFRIADGVVLAPGCLDKAVRVLSGLAEPFTVSQARKALGTTRRVAVPLLERLDAEGRTRRAPDGTRRVRHDHT
ncbi:selenocysteine-specific translation elongation factor [Saccharomonospora xinjiangensis]|uniref:Selenocysteine-specific elongation factor SelB n=1 Tax=Saccharomonospora xinjiangensis XJ-54 TaxID=882086 RepID=I0UX25_9PSEU|nr:selenocysteine-specific translation elongation factor [Saccharomonospora xinjiangensis]EID52428.1 selenocysteine-specific elongation factor SelB [Saccharomonospora xinjiangensis XJ-54]